MKVAHHHRPYDISSFEVLELFTLLLSTLLLPLQSLATRQQRQEAREFRGRYQMTAQSPPPLISTSLSPIS